MQLIETGVSPAAQVQLKKRNKNEHLCEQFTLSCAHTVPIKQKSSEANRSLQYRHTLQTRIRLPPFARPPSPAGRVADLELLLRVGGDLGGVVVERDLRRAGGSSVTDLGGCPANAKSVRGAQTGHGHEKDLHRQRPHRPKSARTTFSTFSPS